MEPTLGAWPEADGFRFLVWAPADSTVDLVLDAPADDGSHARRQIPMAAADDGTWTCHVAGIHAGARYGYLLDGEGPFPDPASRWQPDGVHGLSALVDPSQFAWSDGGWTGVPLAEAVIYELHVGTFTPAGTFAGVAEKLPYLAALGVNVIELMPVGDFPGARNWGYDEVSLFAPAHAYGAPDDLRRLVDAAHAHDLAVILDVVYNHFGPDGAYHFRFSPFYRSPTHTNPWGAAMNFDGPESAHVRAFAIENARHWIREYHLDGLRLDATQSIIDRRPRHIVSELAEAARAEAPARTLLLIAEDDRNRRDVVEPASAGGWGLDAVWADDFHHIARRATAGDHESYFGDFSGDARDLATTINQGWFYAGQPTVRDGAARGTSSDGIPRERMVIAIQNHDQIGNRAFGDRLHHAIDAHVYRALTAVLLMAPETPLLFMGQEWAASTPFQYFTDHNADLGRLVTDGRRREFAAFAAFAHPATRARIPDPQALATFEASHLDWDELSASAHVAMLEWYRTLLHIRRDEIADGPFEATAPDADTLVLTRTAVGGGLLVVAARLRGTGPVTLPASIKGRQSSVRVADPLVTLLRVD